MRAPLRNDKWYAVVVYGDKGETLRQHGVKGSVLNKILPEPDEAYTKPKKRKKKR